VTIASRAYAVGIERDGDSVCGRLRPSNRPFRTDQVDGRQGLQTFIGLAQTVPLGRPVSAAEGLSGGSRRRAGAAPANCGAADLFPGTNAAEFVRRRLPGLREQLVQVGEWLAPPGESSGGRPVRKRIDKARLATSITVPITPRQLRPHFAGDRPGHWRNRRRSTSRPPLLRLRCRVQRPDLESRAGSQGRIGPCFTVGGGPSHSRRRAMSTPANSAGTRAADSVPVLLIHP